RRAAEHPATGSGRDRRRAVRRAHAGDGAEPHLSALPGSLFLYEREARDGTRTEREGVPPVRPEPGRPGGSAARRQVPAADSGGRAGATQEARRSPLARAAPTFMSAAGTVPCRAE